MLINQSRVAVCLFDLIIQSFHLGEKRQSFKLGQKIVCYLSPNGVVFHKALYISCVRGTQLIGN